MAIKPCVKCWSIERNAKGNCRPCDAAHKANWYQKNKVKCLLKNIECAKANPDKSKEHMKAWQSKNKPVLLTYSHNYRARKLENGGRLSGGLAQRLFNLQRGKCACCGEPLGGDYHMDHIMPLALGGSNTDDNMQLLKKRCNLQKKAKHPVDFMQQRGFLL